MEAISSVPLGYYLSLSAIIFAIGAVGVLTRRNAIIIFMCIELMLNSVNLTLVAFSTYLGDATGQIFVLFVMAVAAAEAAIGLAIFLAMYRNNKTINVDEINLLKW
jgi:NADH-quinone oxidoreductase subunit K